MTTTTVADALAEATEAFTIANPASLARFTKARESMPGGNTRTVLHHSPFPLAFASGHHARLTSLDGREYVDLLGEYTAGLFGHSESRILDAVHAALDRGVSFGGVNDAEAEFARLLCARFGLGSVRFTNSGTEANLMALAASVAFTGRRKVLVFEEGYHGGVLSFAHGISRANVPHEWVLVPYNDVDAGRRSIRAGDLAAVIVEPMQGSGGCVPGDPEFLAVLRDECAAAGTLLIFDEVMTSRLSPGGLQAQLGIRPDLTTLGKYLGGGMSFGAFGGRADVMAQFDPTAPHALAHAGTFNNNVLTMNAGIAAVSILDDSALAALNARGDALRGSLNALFADRRVAVSATGIGSLLQIHLPSDDLQHLFFLEMVAAGFWIAARGMLALSLPVGDADCAAFADAVAGVLTQHAPLLAA